MVAGSRAGPELHSGLVARTGTCGSWLLPHCLAKRPREGRLRMALQPALLPPGAVLFPVRQAQPRALLPVDCDAGRSACVRHGAEQHPRQLATARARLGPPRLTPRGDPTAQHGQVRRASWRHGGLGGGLNTRRSGLDASLSSRSWLPAAREACPRPPRHTHLVPTTQVGPWLGWQLTAEPTRRVAQLDVAPVAPLRPPRGSSPSPSCPVLTWAWRPWPPPLVHPRP